MIQSVNSDDDLHPLVSLLECLNPFLDFGSSQRIGKLLGIDTHNEFIGTDEAIFVLNLIWNLSLCSAGRSLVAIPTVRCHFYGHSQ